MGGSPPPPPPAPDPYATAKANQQANQTISTSNIIMGNADEKSPLGSVDYSQNGTQSWTDETGTHNVPTFLKTTTLSPEQQKLYDGQTQLGIGMNTVGLNQLNKVDSILSQPITTDNLPARTDSIGPAPSLQNIANAPHLTGSYDAGGTIQQNISGSQDWSADRQKVEDALYSRLNPQLDRDRTSLETKLVNQGLVRGSEAFNNSMDEYNRSANDARMQVVAAGGQEQSRLAGLDLASGSFHNAAQGQQNSQNAAAAAFANQATQGDFANNLAATSFNNSVGQQNFANNQSMADFQNTARERALQEQLALRQEPLNEISTLMHGGQVTMPQFTQFKASPAPPSDLSQNVYQSASIDSANYRAQVAAKAQEDSAMFGLGGAALGGLFKLSDRRLKRDIVRLGTLENGLGWYAYTYLNGNAREEGVMADEVEAIMPEAVVDLDGWKAVNYSRLGV